MDLSLYRWSGNTDGYLCNTTYQTSECGSTDSPALEVLGTSAKEFYFLPVTLNGISYAGTFEVERCSDTTCSTFLSTAASLGINKKAGSLTFKSVENTNPKYASAF